MSMNKETLNAGDLVCVGRSAYYCTLTERGSEAPPFDREPSVGIRSIRSPQHMAGWWAFVVKDAGILKQGTMLFLADDLYEIRKVS